MALRQALRGDGAHGARALSALDRGRCARTHARRRVRNGSRAAGSTDPARRSSGIDPARASLARAAARRPALPAGAGERGGALRSARASFDTVVSEPASSLQRARSGARPRRGQARAAVRAGSCACSSTSARGGRWKAAFQDRVQPVWTWLQRRLPPEPRDRARSSRPRASRSRPQDAPEQAPTCALLGARPRPRLTSAEKVCGTPPWSAPSSRRSCTALTDHRPASARHRACRSGSRSSARIASAERAESPGA